VPTIVNSLGPTQSKRQSNVKARAVPLVRFFIRTFGARLDVESATPVCKKTSALPMLNRFDQTLTTLLRLSGLQHCERVLDLLVAFGRLGYGPAGRQRILQIEFDLVAVHGVVALAVDLETG